MDKKLKVGVIGATGMVGQNYLSYSAIIRGLKWFISPHPQTPQVKSTAMRLQDAGI